jgi:hypothetical protein
MFEAKSVPLRLSFLRAVDRCCVKIGKIAEAKAARRSHDYYDLEIY